MSIMHDVSISELMHLREQRLSNREIAEKLDCSVETVYRLIGKQPPGIRAPRRTKEKPLPALPAPVVEHESFTQRLEKMRQGDTPPQPKEGALDVLRLVFGPDAVRQYLAMRLYELKTSPGNELGAEDCIRALREMK